MACGKGSDPIDSEEEPVTEEEPVIDKPDSTVFSINSISGSINQGETLVINGGGFSTTTNSTLYFTDFEKGVVGNNVVKGENGLDGDTAKLEKNYLYSNSNPLTGTRVARAYPKKVSFGTMYAELQNLEECFVEFFYRYDIVDYTASPDAPQIKHSRLTAGNLHTSIPHLGITIQGSIPKPTLAFQYDSDASEIGIRYAFVSMTSSEWHRDTYYMKLSKPGVSDGMRFVRTSLGNQWNHSAFGDYFLTNDKWQEPPSVTRGLGAATASFKRFFLPFYHRAQQTTLVDINHIYIHNSLERVFLSTSPKSTASTNFKYVVCPTINRTKTKISIKSMINCLPSNAPIYLYVVNNDNQMNEDGYLIRAAL